MKQIRFLLMMSLMLLAAVSVQANDYLEQKDHYTVMAKGPGVLHFKVPVYSRGARNYYLSSNSQGNTKFYYKKSITDSEHNLFYIDADSYDVNNNDDVEYGKVNVQAGTDEGIIEITNINTGARQVVPNDGFTHTYYVTKKKEADNGQDYVTWLEIDWYMPEKLDSIEFGVYADIKISLAMTENVNYNKYWTFETFRGADAMMTPQLYDAYFYATKETGVSGYGYAAVPYVVYYDPKSYTTTLTGSTSYLTDKRSDNIFVATTDTLQPGFKANFNVYRMKNPSVVMANQTTNAVTIPAYHRIYDFVVKEEKDSFETFTGNNVLTWRVKNPHVADLVEGDYFEIQRALKSDFSDAQTVDVVPMERGLDKSTYKFVDENRDSWTGNNSNVKYLDTLRHEYYNRISDYVLRDANGNPMCELSFSAAAKVAYLPSVPVYYRIRRASASMWGWKGHDFARDATCVKHSFLAPLAGEQPAYTLDAESHKVDFRIRLANADVAAISIPEEDVDLYRISVLSHNPNDTSVMVGIQCVRALAGWARAILRDETETNILQQFDITPGTDNMYKMPKNSVLQILGGRDNAVTTSNKYRLEHDLTVLVENYTNGMINYPTSWVYNDIYDEMAQALTPDELARLNEIMPQLKQEVGQRMAADLNDKIGKCMWDQSARLVLIKTTDGVKQEFIIPQDSIRRLSDGNWEAHYTDLANHACTNYSYSVRIDQSSADLHVSDSAFLLPKVLTGPNLYFEEGASIKSFTASNLADDGEKKRGIMLQWEPTNAAVDSYILTRLNTQRGTKTDTVYTGVDNSFFDTIGVIPVDEYKYTVKAVYDCNGRHTEHEALAIGVRSPYGEIRGQILMPDNSGMAGVTVALQDESGHIVKSVVTGPDGKVVFDKLDYNYQNGTDYTIIPSSQYGTFSFNSTSAGSATVHLREDNCIARDLVFMNTSTTRLSGRALYEGSTIPVVGAMFLLNGDTIRRNGAPLTTGIDGNFELTLTKGQPYKLQIIKKGHTFEGDDILHVTQGTDTFALTQPLDGIRFYDQTKVRLVGRVAGGNDQRNLPEAFGLGKNNLGDDLQLVLELEGDNVSHLVDDPNDPTRDTVQQTFDHLVYTTDPLSAVPSRSVGSTFMRMEKKRIIIRPDAATGEYAVDLYPVKYKVTQATAKGYATLFAAGQGNEVFDLTNAPLASYDPKRGTDSVHYNAVYDRIYHTPVKIHMQQLLYGLAQPGYGEKSMKVSSFNQRSDEEVALYIESSADNIEGADIVTYTMGYPVFCNNRKYQFEAQAYEDYYFNNSPEDGSLDRVPQRGGAVTIHNGMEGTTKHYSYPLDSVGKNRNIYLTVDQLETEFSGTDALHTVSAALEVEGNTVETEVFRAFISGDIIKESELQSTDADITILDIVRDPGGDGSSAWVETGATYNYSYTQSYDINVGIELTPTWGATMDTYFGTVVSIAGDGSYQGGSSSFGKEFSIGIPVTHEIAWSTKYSYTFTTNDKISTSSSKNKQGIGANADVFLGATTSVLTGKAKSVSVINDTMYHQHLPAIQAGTMRILAQGTDTAGKPYYLAVGEKVVLGTTINNTFAYTQYHIFNTLLPRLFLERDNLLEYFADEATAQAMADQRGEEVYWYIDSTTAIQLNDTLAKDTYKMIVPSGDARPYADRVKALDNIILKWIAVLYKNEEEKIKARYMGTSVGTFSVSAGATYNHSDSYTSTFNYSALPHGLTAGSEGAAIATQAAQTILDNAKNFGSVLSGGMKSTFNQLKNLQELWKKSDVENMDVISKSLGSCFKMKWSPVLDFDMTTREGKDFTDKKSTGFTIVPDNQGEITVAVYRAPVDSIWNSTASISINNVGTNVPTPQKYGSYVFFTQAGSTYCPYEDEDETKFYNPGTPLNNSTMLLAKPAMSINTYEQTNVLPDQRAKFTIELRNAGEVQYGWAGSGMLFNLSLANESNPHGAKLYVNGAPLAQGIEFFMEPGQSFKQTLEVERGEVDDYENLRLLFKVSDCPKSNTFLDFSVHYIPLSCDVQIDMPRQNWVMNTLAQRDSAGYYIPVEISGFDTHHKNFDHIEFQYKLSKESDEKWVNQCSFFAEDSLYEKATGNKAMIENGRIVPFRFYGERDPMEQEYDLRAVSFCRYGSGYVHKASTVISGVKDTRVPVLFGDPEPVNSILGVGDHLKLRFSEPIAGNYLDEDNNFSLKGVTNKTGITAGTSLHFDGSENSYASTKVDRNLSDKSVSIDLLVKPAESNQDFVFFSHGSGKNVTNFGLTADRRLCLTSPQGAVYSKPLEAMLDFTRVTMVYDHEQNAIRFFAGTKEMTDASQRRTSTEPLFYNAPLVFGKGFNGNMLEARVWSKALTAEEIAATHLRRLSGYERGLTAYYPMNEGRHKTCTDKANGATLYLNNTTWILQKGISLALRNDSVTLAGNLMSRSDAYDETFMLWYKTAAQNATIFRASTGWLGIEQGLLTFRSDSNAVVLFASASDNEWHHFALAVNRAYNTASFFLDGKLLETVPATDVNGLRGAMYLGGKDFVGNIDELTIYEQALPRSLIEERYNMAPAGDEMGLMAYLPFSKQVLNPNGILELVFSPNDRRVFKDPNGNVIDKVVPLVLTPDAAGLADKTDFAPVRDHGLLNKLNFGWAFNTDELLINLQMQDYEINKQTVYVTVRDVEDLHGNPMQSPVTWSAFVDRNTLKWDKRDVYYSIDYDYQDEAGPFTLTIRNISGRTHQFTIDNAPDWLNVRTAGGTLTALEEKPVELRLTREMAPGEYTETLYLTDENGLAEPLNIHLTVVANPPYTGFDQSKYPMNMSLCGKVLVSTKTDFSAATEDDIVYAFINRQLVGMAHVSFNDRSNESELFLTISGDKEMVHKPVTFQLWRASTGKTYSLYSNREVLFAHGEVCGCGDPTPLYLTTTGTEMLSISLSPGWTWISANLDFTQTKGDLTKCISATDPWVEEDAIKNPAGRQFSTYTPAANAFIGSLKRLHHTQMYMVLAHEGNTLRISGDQLHPDSMQLTLRGNGAWNALPCLLDRTTPLTEALAGYYDHATEGDLIKGKNKFAYFSADRRWVGDLTALTPGEGYLLRRKGLGTVTIRFYNQEAIANKMSVAPIMEESAFHNPAAATNMTMVVKVEGQGAKGNSSLLAYMDDELVGVATKIDSLYFLTIQSDKSGRLHFETADGQTLVTDGNNGTMHYEADAHAGSLTAPVILRVGDDQRPYKIIENNHVTIIRNNEKYDVTGKKRK
ncbi:MAG: hypothetical protein IKQ50_06145 [Paludibacteraceae bacterium]|nr:hypothetical protein [Paludibacteraceae bacterium]